MWEARQGPITRSRFSPTLRRSRYHHQNAFAHTPVMMDVNQVPVTLPINITHPLSLYSTVTPNPAPLIPNACQIYAAPQFPVSPPHQYIAQQNPIPIPQYTHIQTREHHPKLPGPQYMGHQPNPLTLPPQYQQYQAQRGDALELDFLTDPRSSGVYHAQFNPASHPPSPTLHHPLHPVVGASGAPLHTHTPSPPIFLSEVSKLIAEIQS